MRWGQPKAKQDLEQWHLYLPFFRVITLDDSGECCWGEWIRRRWVPEGGETITGGIAGNGRWEYRIHYPNTRG